LTTGLPRSPKADGIGGPGPLSYRANWSFWKRSKCDVVAFSTCLRLNIFTFFMISPGRRTGSPGEPRLYSAPAHLNSPISVISPCNRVVSISIITKVSNLIPIWRSMRHRLERNMLAPKCQMWAPDGNRNGNGNGSRNGSAIEIGSWELPLGSGIRYLVIRFCGYGKAKASSCKAEKSYRTRAYLAGILRNREWEEGKLAA